MDIEKVVESLRYSVETTDRGVQAVCNADTDHPFPVIPLPLPEARALLTEIDYWRARCGAAENMPMAMGDDTGYDEWQAAVAGESDKARYLETLAPAFTCLGGDHGKGIKPCADWCSEDMCKPVE